MPPRRSESSLTATTRVQARSGAIEDIELPRRTTIGATVRGTGDAAEIVISHQDTEINPEEHLIAFVETRRKIPRLEKRLQVGIGFF